MLNALYRMPRVRRAAKGVLSALLPLAGPRLRSRVLQRVEQVIYTNTAVIDELPDAFHHWSNTCLLPRLRRFGFGNAVEFYALQAQALARRCEGPLRITSLGSGRAEVELAVCRLLADRGVRSTWHCVELNPDMQHDARESVAAAGHDGDFHFETGDAMDWSPQAPVDAILCNQFLHHVPGVDGFITRISRALAPHGLLLTHDVIGNHGHVLWPNARQVVDALWPHVPDGWKRDRSGQHVDPFTDLDCSAYSLEGVDAGNVLPALLAHLKPHFFFGYSGFVLAFVDRRFGDGIDLDSVAERRLVEVLARIDVDLLDRGLLAPTQMFGVFGRQPAAAVQGNMASEAALAARAGVLPADLLDSVRAQVSDAA